MELPSYASGLKSIIVDAVTAETEGALTDLVTTSQSWAQGTEPGGPGTKSALEWAETSEAFANSVGAVATTYTTDTGTQVDLITDDKGFPLLEFTAPDLPLVSVPLKTLTKYDWLVVMPTGQSIMVGTQAVEVISTATIPGLKMLSGGVRLFDNAATISTQTIADAIEVSAAQGLESPTRGIGEGILESLQTRHGLSYADHGTDFILCNWGQSGVSLTSLVKGSSNYTNMIAAVNRIKALATAAGKTCAVIAVPFSQGQSGPFTGYGALLEQLVLDFNTDIKAITGQTESIPLLMVQECGLSNYGGTANADANRHVATEQFRVASTNPLIRMVTPDYWWVTTDGIHWPAPLSKRIGGVMGHAVVQECLESSAGWVPLMPGAPSRSGKIVTIPFTGPGELLFDTSTIKDPGNYGFSYVQTDGTTPVAISRVWIAGMSIKLLLASAVPGKLRYAWGETYTTSVRAGPITGARGCLRSRLDDEFTGTGISAMPVRVFAPMFSKDVA